MQSVQQHAVYNSLIAEMSLPFSRHMRVGRVLLLALLLAPVVHGADWRVPAGELAEKIAAATGPGALALEVTNRSSLSRSDVEAVRKSLIMQLAGLGVHIVNANQASATVQVSLSENLQGYVWVADVRQGAGGPSVVLVSLDRAEMPSVARDPAALAVRKTLLWSQEGRILDVAIMSGNPQHMIVLDTNGVTLYQLQDGRWQQAQSLPITHSRPWPRDLRGRLMLRQDHLFDVYLPGTFCRSINGAPLAVNCSTSDDPWPLGNGQMGLNAFYASGRNFFTGALSPGIGKTTMAPTFYSAAALPRDRYWLWVLAGVDGQVHMLDGITDQIASKLGWGSDLASVHSGCGSGWQLLATGGGSGPTDTVRAFELLDREPGAASVPAEFAGDVTALWTEPEGNAALAVSQNAETGRYEAYRLNVVCGQ